MKINQFKRYNVKYHIECIRIIAIMFVIFNHTETKGFFLFSVREESPFYWLYLFISILCRIAVPLFYMVSGALLIPKEESIKDLYKKRILRFLIVILLFSFIQYIYMICKSHSDFNILEYFHITYSYEMATAYWYLYSYLGILVMLPLLRKLANAMKCNDYYYLLICQFALVSVIPIFEFLYFRGNYSLNKNFTVPIITASSIFYFLMGHFLENVLEVKEFYPKRIMIYIFSSIVAILISCFMTNYRAQIMGVCTEKDSQMFHSALINIPTLTTYYCIKYYFINKKLKDKIKILMAYLGGLTFGIMLFENILRTELEFIFIRLNPYLGSILSCGIYVIVVFVCGTIITSILKITPCINKLI